MKKILLTVIVLIGLIGCGKYTIYHTYYGDIDTDTLDIGLYDLDNTPCYKVFSNSKDTIVYYNPAKEIYLIHFPTNDEFGNVVARYNPIDKCIIDD